MKPNTPEKNSQHYQPRSEILSALGKKTLVMLVGPSAIGKSTIMKEVVAGDDNFAYAVSFTTRPPRVGEQSAYRFITPDEADQLYADQTAITYVTHPTTGDVYGTDLASYPKPYTLLDTLANSVEQYRALPFQDVRTLSLTAPTDQWRQWFLDRYPWPSDEAKNRLVEAKQSIEWSLARTGTHDWLINNGGEAIATAHTLIEIARDGKLGNDGRNHASALLRTIDDGLW